VLQLERLPLPSLTGAAQLAFVQAAQRCLQCRSNALCDEVLDERAAEPLRHFCPNSRYIDSMRSA
jgi:hypothetical protein